MHRRAFVVFLAATGLFAALPARLPAQTISLGKLDEATPTPAGYTPARPTNHPAPAYPELAHLNRATGKIKVKFSVDETGKVTNAIVAGSGGIMLDTAVRDTRLREWSFQPATLNGKPIASTYFQEFEFRLDPEEERAIALKRLALPFGTPEPPYPAEAAAAKLAGEATIGVYWENVNGLVDHIYLIKSSGNGFLDRYALRWAYEHWRVDPKTVTETQFVKTLSFKAP